MPPTPGGRGHDVHSGETCFMALAKPRERRAEPRLPVYCSNPVATRQKSAGRARILHRLTSEFRPLLRATIRHKDVRVLSKNRVHQNVTSPNNGRGARMMPSEKGKAADVAVRHRATTPKNARALITGQDKPSRAGPSAFCPSATPHTPGRLTRVYQSKEGRRRLCLPAWCTASGWRAHRTWSAIPTLPPALTASACRPTRC